MICKVFAASLLAPLCWMSACTDPMPPAPDAGNPPAQPDHDAGPPPCSPGSQPSQKTRSLRRDVGGSRVMRGTRLHDHAIVVFRATGAASAKLSGTPSGRIDKRSVCMAHARPPWLATCPLRSSHFHNQRIIKEIQHAAIIVVAHRA